jgi:hypothetical protein
MAEFLSDVAPANIARIYARLPLSRLRLPGASCVYATKIAVGLATFGNTADSVAPIATRLRCDRGRVARMRQPMQVPELGTGAMA